MYLRRYEENFKSRIVYLRREGFRVSELAKIFEISEASIYRWNKKMRSAEPENFFECKLLLEFLLDLDKKQRAMEKVISTIKNLFFD